MRLISLLLVLASGLATANEPLAPFSAEFRIYVNKLPTPVKAELVLEVFDASAPADGSEIDKIASLVPEGTHHLLLKNKIDRGEDENWKSREGVRLSCKDNQGIDDLTEAIFEKLGGPSANWGADLVAINARHKRCLNRASEDIANARHRLESGESPEFAALDLRSALEAIGEVVGKTDVEEILGEIFSTFCIGK